MPDRELRLLPADEDTVVIAGSGDTLSWSPNTAKTRLRVKTVHPVTPPPVDPPPVEPPPPGAFLSYPDLPRRESEAQNYAVFDSPTDLVLSKQKVVGIGIGQRAIVIRKPKGILHLLDLDFQDCGEVIYIVDGDGLTELRIERNRVNRILGPSHVNGQRTQNLANFVQVYQTRVKGRIGDNRVRGGNTEDIISITGTSGGKGPNEWLDVEDNRLDGTGWTSVSGSGIAGSDGAGGYTRIRRNTLLNPGQLGFFFASGGPGEASENLVYSRVANGNQPWYVAKYGAVLPHDIRIHHNVSDFVTASGRRSGWIGEVGANVTEDSNDPDGPIDPATLAVTL